MAYVHILKLEIIFNCDFEHLGKDIGTISKALCRRKWRLEHAKRALTLAIMTTESPEALLDRIRATLDSLYTVVDYWCSMAPTVVFAKNGDFDPTRSFLKEAWAAARERNYPEKLKNA